MTEQKDRNPIEVLAAEFVERHRRGERPTVEEYVEQNPELAAAIQDLFPTILAMEQLKAHKESSSTPRKSLLGPNLNERLGDYILLREIGRGGMGIVYEAEQESLGRRVALKVLPRQSFDDEKKLQRFQREAQTAARLHHTNIVPIFGVGEQDGFHYYVMQFIPGLGLDAVLKAMRHSEAGSSTTDAAPSQSGSDNITLMPVQAVQALRSGRFQHRQEVASSSSQDSPLSSPPSIPESTTESDDDARGNGQHSSANGHQARVSDRAYWRSVAQVGAQVSDALHYAHDQGTLHRDIKPANLILDAYGVVWVTDFGLAKAVEQAHLTHSGDVVGTLQYMAPEQFHGKFDARSDIYCLGLTLYEMLTLRPAYADSSRSGLVHKVAHGAPTPPRKLRPNIPDDLEVIVLKAISKEPAHRYQTAAEFKEDLENFLGDRPINARRTTAIEHAWRWCRRNKAVASLSMVALLLLIATTVVGYVGWVMTNTAYGRASQSAKHAEESAKRAEENLRLSLKAFADIFEDIAGGDRLQPAIEDPDRTELENITGTEADDAVPQPPVARTVVSEQDAALLQRILRFYDRFAEANAGNKNLYEETAKAHFRIGKIHSRLNHVDQAREAYLHSLKMYEALGQNESGNDAYRDEKAAIHNDLGQTLRSQPGRRARTEASRQHQTVLALMGVDPASNNTVTPDTVRGQYELARAYRFLARRQRDRQQLLERSLELIEGLLAKDPKNHHFRLAKAMSCTSLANVHAGVEPAAAIAKQAEAIQVLEALAEDFPNAGQFRYELARALAPRMRSSMDFYRNYHSESEHAKNAKRLLRAKVIGEQLVKEFPTVTAYKWSLIQHCSSLGAIYRRLGKNKDAEPCYRRALALHEELASLPGASPGSRFWLNESRIDLARVLIANQKPEPALKELDACLALVAELDTEESSSSRATGRLWSIHRTMARALRLLGKETEAQNHEKQGKEASRRWAHSFIRRADRRR